MSIASTGLSKDEKRRTRTVASGRRPPEKRAFSIEEFAARNGICRDNVYKEIREGRLKARKAGKRTLISDVDEAAWRDALPVLELPAA